MHRAITMLDDKVKTRLEAPPNEDLITLDLPRKVHLQGHIERKADGKWWIKVKPEQAETLLGLSTVHVKYILNYQLYWGKITVLAVNAGKGLVTLSEPKELSSRAVRRYFRVDTSLPGAVIVMSGENLPGQYIYRSRNMICNLSLGGAMLACKELFDEGIKDFILVTSLDPEDAFNGAAQVAFRCGIVRLIPNQAVENYPYCYGLEFKQLFPEFRDKLGYFLLDSG